MTTTMKTADDISYPMCLVCHTHVHDHQVDYGLTDV